MIEQLPWRGLFWLSFGAWIAMEIGIWARDRRSVRGQREDRASVVALVFAITVGMTLAFNSARFKAPIPLGPELRIVLGLLLIWSGMALRFWSVRTLGRFFRVTVTMQEDHRLIDSGPYRRISNPSYTGAMLTLAGIGLAIGSWVSLAALIVLPLLAFAWRIKVEEASLHRRFGDAFIEYRRARWALLPPIW